jgi:predicted RNase H-like HicB family nuclease
MKIEINIRQTASGGFRADSAAMPGCVAIGQTQEQACQNMRQEVAWYVASMDGISPEQMDLVVTASIRPREMPEPELPVETPQQLDVFRKQLLSMLSGRQATR